MSGTGAPARCSARLLAAVVAFLLCDGLVVTDIAASSSIDFPVISSTSTVTRTSPHEKAPSDATASRAFTTVGSSTIQESTWSKFSPPGNWTDDAGALLVALSVEGGKVKLQFPTTVTWVAMPPELAIILAQGLIEHAIKAGHPQPITIRIGGFDG